MAGLIGRILTSHPVALFACAMRLWLSGLVLVSTMLAGCANGPVEQASQQPASVVAPGKPGEPGAVLPQDQAGRRPAGTPNDVDVNYVTMMIPHHQQAITMTDLVAGRATDEQVRGIAGRIAASQGAEISMMSAWLTQRALPVPGTGHDHGAHSGHQPAAMPGMATPEQLAALRAASGREFDRQFLELMITHHRGALTMAERALADGVETRVQEMAQEVVAGQTAEIEQMRTVRAKL